MAALDIELAAYRQEETQLAFLHPGKWVVFKGATRVAIHDSFNEAAEDAVSKFGRGPYLIRRIGEPPIVMPVSAIIPLT